jgi:hypothetical protein
MELLDMVKHRRGNPQMPAQARYAALTAMTGIVGPASSTSLNQIGSGQLPDLG